jgi:predicted acyltransferase
MSQAPAVETAIQQPQTNGAAAVTAEPAVIAAVPAKPPKAARLASLDAYRGFIMLAMASAGLGLPQVARSFPDSPIWRFLGYQFEHVLWTGCAFWDLIQPSFMFMVGVAMPYSFASRAAQGDSFARRYAHTIYRALILVLLGVFLTSNGSRETDWGFANVLCQIGLGYAFVYLLIDRGRRVQFLAAAGILLSYWLYFLLYPAPPADFVYPKLHNRFVFQPLVGLAAHWNFTTNAAAAFDQWFLNLFPRSKPFEFSTGGYTTLNFVPSMATMIFGLMAGELLRGQRPAAAKLKALLLGGLACFALVLLVDHTIWPDWLTSEGFREWSLCPSVKRIWTPTWAVFSTGWTLWILAAFYWVIDMQGYQRWAFPLVVVGMNSIAMYCMSQLTKGWVRQSLQTHFGQGIFQGTYGPLVASVSVLFVLWLACFWMYRQKVFVRI